MKLSPPFPLSLSPPLPQKASVALEEVPRRLVGRPDAQPIVATNVFVRAASGAWKVSMHHASVVMR